MLKFMFAPLFVLPLLRSADTENASVQIRVALIRNAENLSLATKGRLYLFEKPTGEKYQLLPDSNYLMKPKGNKIKIDGKSLYPPITLIPPEGEERIKINSQSYAGEITISIEDSLLCIVENVPIENYLAGVLPFEMSPLWPLEALKAQAVVSRTFAIKNLKPDLPYDITSGTEKQVYKGINEANKRILRAIQETKGEVLTYRGELIRAYFHSCCGGHTASNYAVWGEKIIRPLRGVRDPFCRHSKKYYWQLSAGSSEILKFARQHGSKAIKIKRLRVLKKDSSGRALKLKIYTNTKPLVVRAYDLRKFLGPRHFKSTLIYRIKKTKEGFKFYGKGWGHGVGMCQEGAKAMAKKGKSYRQILRHYYPKARIKHLK